ncbi:hypothetical protein JCM8547_005301 [Rhodosporidiobolus lusitaniae]
MLPSLLAVFFLPLFALLAIGSPFPQASSSAGDPELISSSGCVNGTSAGTPCTKNYGSSSSSSNPSDADLAEFGLSDGSALSNLTTGPLGGIAGSGGLGSGPAGF